VAAHPDLEREGREILSRSGLRSLTCFSFLLSFEAPRRAGNTQGRRSLWLFASIGPETKSISLRFQAQGKWPGRFAWQGINVGAAVIAPGDAVKCAAGGCFSLKSRSDLFDHFVKEAREQEQWLTCGPGEIGGLIGGSTELLEKLRIGSLFKGAYEQPPLKLVQLCGSAAGTCEMLATRKPFGLAACRRSLGTGLGQQLEHDGCIHMRFCRLISCAVFIV